MIAHCEIHAAYNSWCVACIAIALCTFDEDEGDA